MKKVLVVLVFAIVAAAAGWAVLKTVLGLVVAGLIGGVIGGVVASLLIRKELKETKSVYSAEVPSQQNDPAVKVREMLEKLLQLNLAVRLAGLSQNALCAIEGVINKLRDVLPEVNDRYPGTDVAWEINESASVYLPNFVKPFLDLGPGVRVEKESSFISSLGGLQEAIEESFEMVEKQKEGAFDVKARFMNVKFGN